MYGGIMLDAAPKGYREHRVSLSKGGTRFISASKKTLEAEDPRSSIQEVLL